jgi:ABC-2 type transport system ATP-binding protein
MVEVINLTKKYGNKIGVKNISFTAEKGEILGFLGPNGAGKSTTMNVITGYRPPTEGKVLIGGYDIAEKPLDAKRKLGYLPEIPPLYPELKVKSYLKFICDLKGYPRQKRESHINEIMDLVKITDVKDRLIKNLSKGYRQRVGLAQALVSSPDVLILDEPTVGLDPKQIQEMRSLIKSLGKEHTIILSSHILAEVSMICDKVIIIKKGEIAAIDTPENLAKNMAAAECFQAKIKGPGEQVADIIGGIDGVISVKQSRDKNDIKTGLFSYLIENKKSVDVRTPLFFKMAELGYPIHEIKSVAVNLEDIFLQLTAEEDENTEVE